MGPSRHCPPTDLIRAVPGLGQLPIDLAAEDLRRLPGASLSFDDMQSVAAIVEQRCASGADGVVITQGTDTIEESAYLLDLLHAGSQPVVVTGAMRNATLAGADGPANLLAAIQVAASLDARGQGCLVVLADEIHAASRVRKTHSTSLTTFQSPNGGPLGYVVEGRPHLLNHLPVRFWVPFDPSRPDGQGSPRVGLAVISFDDDGALLEGAADRLDGLVLAGFGVGHVPRWLVDDLTTMAARIPVVLASRTGAGSVLAATYSFPGSEATLIAAGLIPRVASRPLQGSHPPPCPPGRRLGPPHDRQRLRRGRRLRPRAELALADSGALTKVVALLASTSR